MPGKSGIEGLKELRKIDLDVSVIMLTAFGTLETAQQAIRLGANEYLNKPFSTKEMDQVLLRYTERTRLMRSRLRASRELKELNTQLAENIAQSQKEMVLDKFSSEFIHDLRNPLSIVMGYIQLLSEELEQCQAKLGGQYKEASDYLEIIKKNVDNCQELIQAWKSIGKGYKCRLETISVSSFIKDVVVATEPLAAKDRVDLEHQIPTKDMNILANRTQLLRVIHNLIENALQAVSRCKEKRVCVRCWRSNGNVKIYVEDTGAGIKSTTLFKVFEPYYTTKKKQRGRVGFIYC
ncbi:MAG: response regulator [Kiritimatiellae bacterium]|nr:response regulator [Kiritimatiellia bacterium]